MNTPTQLMFANFKQCLNLDVDEHPLWDFIEPYVRTHPFSFDGFAFKLSTVYSGLLKTSPELAKLTDPLFLAMVLHSLNTVSVHPEKTPQIELLFGAWTIQGTRDISKRDAQSLTPQLQLWLKAPNDVLVISAKKMVYLSNSLWSTLKSTILQQNSTKIKDPLLLHRFEPHTIELDISETRTAYAQMCGYFSAEAFTVESLSNLLVGPHNNPTAWIVALQTCVKKIKNHRLTGPS